MTDPLLFKVAAILFVETVLTVLFMNYIRRFRYVREWSTFEKVKLYGSTLVTIATVTGLTVLACRLCLLS